MYAKPLRWMVLLACMAGVLGGGVPRKTGDIAQAALPLAAVGCAVMTGGAGAMLGRYVGLQVALTVSKDGLGRHELNRRPDGAFRGFPSGHTAAATFGAVGLAQTCLASSPPALAVAVGLAAFTGGSRVLAERHTPLQVIAGAVFGYTAQLICMWAVFGRWRRRVAGRKKPSAMARLLG